MTCHPISLYDQQQCRASTSTTSSATQVSYELQHVVKEKERARRGQVGWDDLRVCEGTECQGRNGYRKGNHGGDPSRCLAPVESKPPCRSTRERRSHRGQRFWSYRRAQDRIDEIGDGLKHLESQSSAQRFEVSDVMAATGAGREVRVDKCVRDCLFFAVEARRVGLPDGLTGQLHAAIPAVPIPNARAGPFTDSVNADWAVTPRIRIGSEQ